MSKKHLDNVNFDFIRYSNCWEDADVLLKGLNINKNSRVLSIASAGDNCFALLAQDPKQVVAVDINPTQLYLVELKAAAIKLLDRTAFMAFSGFLSSSKRMEVYALLKDELSAEARKFWDENIGLIESGIIHTGKFEKYFQLFVKEALPTVHRADNIKELIRTKTKTEQIAFHDNVWNSDEWKVLYRNFFGAEMMGSHGRDPEFLKHVKGDVAEIMLNREIAHFRKVEAQANYFLHYMLFNSFNQVHLPYYVREGNYSRVKSNLHNLELYLGLVEDAMEAYPAFSHFNLSDIFEYMSDVDFIEFGEDILAKSADKARFAYWNLMVPRRLSNDFPGKLDYNPVSKNLADQDLGYFYGDFIIEDKK